MAAASHSLRVRGPRLAALERQRPESGRSRRLLATLGGLGVVLSLASSAAAQPAREGSIDAPVLLHSEAPPSAMFHRTEPLTPVWVSGLHISVIGHTFGVIWASAYRCTGCGAESSTMAIPLVGGFVWAGLDDNLHSNIAQVIGVPTSILQLLGFGLMIAGAIGRRRVPDERLPMAGVALRPDGVAIVF